MSNFKKDVFGRGGMLHRAFGDRYEMREQQVNMSVDCAKTILNRGILFAEGATGVGKSFAYLIASVSPSIREILKERGHDAPIVISTSTKILQDQIVEKDAPAIVDATGQDLRGELAKGRNNYVSYRRMERFIEDIENLEIAFDTAEVAETANRIAGKLPIWADTSEGELSTFDEDIPYQIKQHIESTNNDCLGKSCASVETCAYYAARNKRATADILIVNHALLASHLAFPNVLPEKCNTYIIDEAHKFFESVSGVFEDAVRLRQLEWYFKQFRTRLKQFSDLVEDISPQHREVMTETTQQYEMSRNPDAQVATEFFEYAINEVYTTAINNSIVSEKSAQFGYAILTPNLDVNKLLGVLSKYPQTCVEIADELDLELEDDPDALEEKDALTEQAETHLRLLYKTAFDVLNKVKNVTYREDAEKFCYWSDVVMTKDKSIDSPYQLTLKSTPIDITQQIAPLFDEDNAVIFTSATLQVSNRFDAIKAQMGLDKPEYKTTQRVYPSPFPFKKNVEIHLFDDVIVDRPAPSADDEVKEAYLTQQAQLVEYYLRLRDGRALVLCVSQQMLYELTERVTPAVADMEIDILKQYNTDRLRQTFTEFKENERSVLFGVASCWEGLDAPGSTLETVIIPQLPFAPPHPVLESRKQLLDNPERDWFWQIALPSMLLQLKQGAGRLVRSMTDTGVITILSPRPMTKSYGNQIKQVLPPAKIVCNPTEAVRFIIQLKEKFNEQEIHD